MRIMDIYLNRNDELFRFVPYGHRRQKHMKAMKKDLAGVSPVIAVILMVAITVVLAGVVFLWAQSFTEDAGGGAKTLSVELELMEDPDAALPDVTAETDLVITPLKGNIIWADYQLIFNGAVIDTSALAAVTTNVGIDQTIDVSGAAELTVGTEYTVKMIFIEDQSVILDTDVVCKSG
jgi:flagellin-like protein